MAATLAFTSAPGSGRCVAERSARWRRRSARVERAPRPTHVTRGLQHPLRQVICRCDRKARLRLGPVDLLLILSLRLTNAAGGNTRIAHRDDAADRPGPGADNLH